MKRYASLALFVCLATGQVENEQRAKLRAGMALLQRGDTEGAIRELRTAVALDPKAAQSHLLLGQAYLARQSVALFAEAQAEFRQALDLDPKLIYARFYLARMYVDLGRNEKAREQLRAALETTPDVPLVLGLLGEVERKLGNPAVSVTLNRKALAIDPSMTPCHYHIGLALLDLRRDAEALSELEAAVAAKLVTPEMWVALSQLYQKRNRLADAEQAAKRAIALDVSKPEGHLALAQVYNGKGAGEKALDEVYLALPEGRGLPSSPYFQQLRSDVYFEQGRAYETARAIKEAVAAYEKSLEYEPDRVEAHQRLAELYKRQKNTVKTTEHAAAAERLKR